MKTRSTKCKSGYYGQRDLNHALEQALSFANHPSRSSE